MIQNQNTTKANNDPEIEDIPVHTMMEDLAEINNPGSTKMTEQNIERIAPRKPINQDNLSTAQKSSPFLNPTPEVRKPEPVKVEPARTAPVRTNPVPSAPPAPVTPVAPTTPAPQVTAPIKSAAPVTPKEPSIETKKPSAGKKGPFILILLSLLAVLLAGGGYYFWKIRQQKVAIVVQPTEDILPVETVPEAIPELPKKETFSTDKPNYLNIEDTSTPAGDNTKDLLAFHANKVAQSAITTPIEFSVVDDQNNPILFSVFATKLNITFSKPLLANLKGSFSLFIYNDGPSTRIGLSIDSKDTAKLKALMANEEKNLATELAPILLSSNYTMSIKSYGSSTYKNLPIRYANITSPEDLSVDYTILPKTNKLLIGTTKMTLRAIIDHIDASAISAPATDSPTSNTANPVQNEVSATPIQP